MTPHPTGKDLIQQDLIVNLHSFPASGISRATLLATSLGLAAVVQANDIIKLDNSDALNTGGSWTGGNVPTASDVGVWDSTVTAENITVLGGDLSWAGIKIADPGGAVTIDAGSTLSLGASGIDLSAATQNLTLNNAISLGTAQIWNVASDRTLTAGGVIGGTGTLTKSGAGTLTLSAANTFANGATISDGTIIAGNNAAFGTGT